MSFMKEWGDTFRGFWSVMSWQTLIIAFIAVISTFACGRLGLVGDIPTGLIGLAVVFPIVFSINAAYRRREEALRYFSGIKSHAVALYYAHRDWLPESAEAGDDNGSGKNADRYKALFLELLDAVETYIDEKGRSPKELARFYSVLSRLSLSHERLREDGVPANEISRANQYLSKIASDFEKMRNIADYRTPVSLRAYSRIFLNAFPVIFGPYFALLSQKHFMVLGYLVAITYSVVLVTLDRIQDDLEDPFDQVGTDDVKLNIQDEYAALLVGREEGVRRGGE